MIFLYYTKISKPNTLWIILPKYFHSGTFRLIFKVYSNSLTLCDSMTCCISDRLSILPLPPFSQISFHWNWGFFLATLIFCQSPKNFYRNICQESFCNFTRSEPLEVIFHLDLNFCIKQHGQTRTWHICYFIYTSSFVPFPKLLYSNIVQVKWLWLRMEFIL